MHSLGENRLCLDNVLGSLCATDAGYRCTLRQTGSQQQQQHAVQSHFRCWPTFSYLRQPNTRTTEHSCFNFGSLRTADTCSRRRRRPCRGRCLRSIELAVSKTNRPPISSRTRHQQIFCAVRVAMLRSARGLFGPRPLAVASRESRRNDQHYYYCYGTTQTTHTRFYEWADRTGRWRTDASAICYVCTFALVRCVNLSAIQIARSSFVESTDFHASRSRVRAVSPAIGIMKMVTIDVRRRRRVPDATHISWPLY